jgi:hypothetical protein
MILYPSGPEAATRFLKFVNASPTPFHAVHNAALRLEKAGFQKVCSRPMRLSHLELIISDSRERRVGEDSPSWGKVLFYQVRFHLPLWHIV